MSQVQQAVHVWVRKVAKELAAAGLPCVSSLDSAECTALLFATGSMCSTP